jgi:hypothetical protein
MDIKWDKTTKRGSILGDLGEKFGKDSIELMVSSLDTMRRGGCSPNDSFNAVMTVLAGVLILLCQERGDAGAAVDVVKQCLEHPRFGKQR